MESSASPDMIKEVCRKIERLGFNTHLLQGHQGCAIEVTGGDRPLEPRGIRAQPGVKDIVFSDQPYRLVSREFKPDNTVVEIRDVRIGGSELTVMAGPCAVENRVQCMAIAQKISASGARVFRGGAYKPRTSPYSFQGLGIPGLEILAEVREKFGLLIVTEAMDAETIDLVAQYADIIQIGSRNMQNYSLLKSVGKKDIPVLLKRGMSATIREFLMAAEYIMAGGNHKVILCERGVRTFVDHTRNTLDLSIVPAVKQISHLPIIVDPSHGTGRREQVIPMSRAAVAAGADGLLVEVHHDPVAALSDGPQSISPEMFDQLLREVKAINGILNGIRI